MLRFLSESPMWLQILIALVLIGISTALLLVGLIWPWGWIVGTVLLCVSLLFSGKSEAAKKGYHDF